MEAKNRTEITVCLWGLRINFTPDVSERCVTSFGLCFRHSASSSSFPCSGLPDVPDGISLRLLFVRTPVSSSSVGVCIAFKLLVGLLFPRYLVNATGMCNYRWLAMNDVSWQVLPVYSEGKQVAFVRRFTSSCRSSIRLNSNDNRPLL